MLFSCLSVSGCSEEEEEVIPADYGTYGADFARTFASLFPYRVPFSDNEIEAGEYIKAAAEDLGYEVTVQEVTYGVLRKTQNYLITIPGDGFYMADENGDYQLTHRTAVIGAHYDSFFSADNTPAVVEASTDEEGEETTTAETEEGEVPTGVTTYGYDGISDNASGVACVLTMLSQAKEYSDMGFDLVFAFFGAGNSDFAGANYYLNSLTDEERDAIEVMYCVDSIYAGDKVYAHSGWASLKSGQKYEMRRQLYKTYDVCYKNTLNSNYGFDMYFNETDIKTDVNGDGTEDYYAEVSLNTSDWVPFDKAGIPVVYVDSFDYNFDDLEDMKDTKNLNLQEFDGMVRNTFLDASKLLDTVYMSEDDEVTDDILQTRINCVAFVILETLNTGSSYGMDEDEYNEFLENQKLGEEVAESIVEASQFDAN